MAKFGKHIGKTLTVGASILLLTACNETFTIDAPSKDFVDNDQPEIFKVSFQNGKPDNLLIQLNSENVTSLFTVDESTATATGDSLAQHIFPGRNVFRVTGGIGSQYVYFYYDIVGPKIHILEASHANGNIMGYLQDSAGIDALTIDGQSLAVDDKGHFSGTFSSKPINTMSATDSYGNVNTVQYARNDQRFHPAISTRINEGGFKFLGEALEVALEDVDFGPIFRDAGPLVDILGFRLRANEMSFSKPSINIEVLDNERLALDFDIPNLVVSTQIGYDILPIRSTVEIDSARVSTRVLLDIRNKDLSVDVRGTSVQLEGMDLKFDNFPNLIDRNIFLEGLSNAFIGIMIGPIENIIVPVVSDFLGEIPVKVDITTHENETLRIEALPEYLDTFTRGMTMDLGATITAPFPSSSATPTLGHPYTPGDTPTIGEQTPDGKDFDIGASISTNLINQALLAAHESGITRMQIRPDTVKGTTPEGVSVIRNDGGEAIQTSDLIGMRLEPVSPPSITLLDREGTWGNLVWYDVKLAFDLKRVGWDDYQTLFVTTFNLEVPFELGATDDGFLKLGIEQLPTIEILESEEKGSLVLSPKFINGILDHFMPVVLPRVAGELKSVPLPRIAGHSIRPEQFWVSGSGKNNLSLAGSMIKLATTEAAPAPDTRLEFAGQISTALSSENTRKDVENGNVIIDINGVNPEQEPLEFRYRLDDGDWSVWKERDNITLLRLLGGEHTLEVCARTVLLKKEVECPSLDFTTGIK